MAARKQSSRDAKKRASASGRKRSVAARKASRAKSADEEKSSEKVSAAEGKLYYRIGEVSKLTDIKPHVLRYWETEFRWMAPPKSRSKQRLYRKKDIETILTIKQLLYDERYTIAGAKQRLRELGLEGAPQSARKAKAGPAKASSTKLASPRRKKAQKTEVAAEESVEICRRLRVELQEIRSLL